MDDSHNLVGKSEMDMERELIQLIEKGNACEKRGEYHEAIAILEQAMKIAHYTGALKKKIDQIRQKLKESKAPLAGSSPEKDSNQGSSELEELDKELMELSEELHQDVESHAPSSPTPTPPQDMVNSFGDLFDESPSPPAAPPQSHDLGDLFGESPSTPAAPPQSHDLGDLFGESPSTPAAPSQAHDLGDLFGESPSPSAAPSQGHDLGDLFGESAPSETARESSDAGLEALLDSGISGEEEFPAHNLREREIPEALETKKKATQEEIFSGILGDEEEEDVLDTSGGILEEEELFEDSYKTVPPPKRVPAPAPPLSFQPPASPMAPPVYETKRPISSPGWPTAPQKMAPHPTSPAVKRVILLSFLFSLTFLCVMAFCSWKIWERKKLYDQGLQAFQNKNYKEALELIEESSKGPFPFLVDLKKAGSLIFQSRLKESHAKMDGLLSKLDTLSLLEQTEKLAGELNQFKKQSQEEGKEELEKFSDKLKACQLWQKTRELQREKKYDAEGALLKEILSLVPTNKFALERYRELEIQWQKKIQVLCYGKLWEKSEQEARKFSGIFGEGMLGEVRQSKALFSIHQNLLEDNFKEAARFIQKHLKTYFLDWKVREFYQKKKGELKEELLKHKSKKKYAPAVKVLKKLRAFTYAPSELKELDVERMKLEKLLKNQ